MDKTLMTATATIVAGQAAGSRLTTEELLKLIPEVYSTLSTVAEGGILRPAVPIEESVTDDHIVCLEDGEKVTLLARYIKKHHGLTPEEYITKWGLPDDYPFVAPEYSKRRSLIAQEHGLGKSKD